MTKLKQHLGYPVKNVAKKDKGYEISIEADVEVVNCEYCNSNNLVKFGTRNIKIPDLPLDNTPVVVDVSLNRYHCKECNRTFIATLPERAVNHSITKRLSSYISNQSLSRSVSQVAKEVGVNQTTTRDVFISFCEARNKELVFDTPECLGIECVSIVKPSTLLINLDKNSILNLLEGQTAKGIEDTFKSMFNVNEVKYVYISMLPEYKKLVLDTMPNATLIVHKDHILKLADDSVERARIAVRSSLSVAERRALTGDKQILLKRLYQLSDGDKTKLIGWSITNPEIYMAYKLKESIYNIWDSHSASTAKALYSAWKLRLSPMVNSYFAPMTTLIDQWFDEVFTYFDNLVVDSGVDLSERLESAAKQLPRSRSFIAVKGALFFEAPKTKYGIESDKFFKAITD